MSSLLQLHDTHVVAHAIGVIALVCGAGMALGIVKIGGIRLGTAGVLFAGLVAGHLGKPVDQATLDFVKELGLVLFVFTIGLQLGPGFLAALREAGVRLNALAAGVVLVGAGLAVALGRLLGLDPAGVLGMLAGATTNTPSLGAAQQTLSTLPGVVPNRVALPALAYAVSYPAGVRLLSRRRRRVRAGWRKRRGTAPRTRAPSGPKSDLGPLPGDGEMA
jgi:putative transport protein